MRPSVALALFALAGASAVATACTHRHRLGGRYDDGVGGEAGAADTPPQGSGGAPATGGSGNPTTGGSSQGATAGAGGSSQGATGGTGGRGGTAGAGGFGQQPEPGLLP